MADFIPNRFKWKARRNALYEGSREAEAFFFKAVLAGTDFKQGRPELSVDSLLAERFPSADSLLEALYPEHIPSLRRLIPTLGRISAVGFEQSHFADEINARGFIEDLMASEGDRPDLAMALDLSDFRTKSELALPEGLDQTLAAVEPGALYERAWSQWDRAYRPDYLAAVLERLANGDLNDLYRNDSSVLKAMRKDSARLRGVFAMFDARHQAPGEFGKFVVLFGKLNDAIDNHSAAKIRSRAVDLRNWLARHTRFSDAAADFIPSQRGSIFDHFAESAWAMRSSLAKSVLDEEEFHDVRKRLKDFMYLAYLLSDLSPGDSVMRMTHDYLYRLNQDMGWFRDNMRRSNDKPSEFPVPPLMKWEILRFLNAFQGARS